MPALGNPLWPGGKARRGDEDGLEGAETGPVYRLTTFQRWPASEGVTPFVSSRSTKLSVMLDTVASESAESAESVERAESCRRSRGWSCCADRALSPDGVSGCQSGVGIEDKGEDDQSGLKSRKVLALSGVLR